MPFLEAIDSDRAERSILEKGTPTSPQAKLHSIVVSRFRASLSRSLAKASGSPGGGRRPETRTLLTNAEKHDLERQDVDDDDVEGITPEQIDALADQSMPLWLQQFHYALKRDHKLKHWGRAVRVLPQGGGAVHGRSVALLPGRVHEDHDARPVFEGALHNIRHRYGKEGKRTEYSPYGCYKLVMDMAPGPGEYHGCPYRHFDADHLRGGPQDVIGCRRTVMQLGKAKERNYQIACQRHFEFAHKKQTVNGKKVVANLDGVGNHPNAWFKASRVYHQDLHAAEHPEEAAAKEAEKARHCRRAQSQVEGMVLAN